MWGRNSAGPTSIHGGRHAARCANIVIPQELEKVLKVLKLGVEKDKEGNRLTLAMSLGLER